MSLIELIKMTSYKSEHIIFIKFIYFYLTIIHKYIEFSDLKKKKKYNYIYSRYTNFQIMYIILYIEST